MTRSLWFDIAALCVASLAAAGAQAGNDTRSAAQWRGMVLVCVDYARTERLPDAAGWTHGLVGASDAEFEEFGTGARVQLRPIEAARQGREALCEPGAGLRIAGNDTAGLALRAIAHEVLDPVLDFRREDQFGPSDTWRGCAFDGLEFRLSSMTQTTYASFWISVSPRDPACAYLGS